MLHPIMILLSGIFTVSSPTLFLGGLTTTKLILKNCFSSIVPSLQTKRSMQPSSFYHISSLCMQEGLRLSALEGQSPLQHLAFASKTSLQICHHCCPLSLTSTTVGLATLLRSEEMVGITSWCTTRYFLVSFCRTFHLLILQTCLSGFVTLMLLHLEIMRKATWRMSKLIKWSKKWNKETLNNKLLLKMLQARPQGPEEDEKEYQPQMMTSWLP